MEKLLDAIAVSLLSLTSVCEELSDAGAVLINDLGRVGACKVGEHDTPLQAGFTI
jgi:hypothetical protein